MKGRAAECSSKKGTIWWGAAFEVYNVQGYGMAEDIYQQSLEIELGLRTIPFISKAPVFLSYRISED